MEWLTRTSLRTTLLTVFLVLGLVPLLATSLFAYQSAESSLTDDARQRVADVAYNAIDKLDRNLFERYGDVQAFAQSDPARSMEPERITAWMNSMTATYAPIYRVMVVADRGGKIVAVNTVDLNGNPLASAKGLVGRDVSGERWFRETLAGNVKDGTSLVEDLHADALVAAVYGTGNQADLAMSFSAPIKDKNGTIVGVWSNRFNWDVATTVLDEVEARARVAGMSTVRLALVDRTRTTLSAPNASQVIKQSLAGRPSLQISDRQRDGRGNGPGLASGQPAFEAASGSIGYSTYPGLGWAVIATQDVAEAVSNAAQLRVVLIAVVLVVALLITLSAWSIASFISRRVSVLATAAHQIATNDLPSLTRVIRGIGENDFGHTSQVSTERLAVTGKDEVGVMAENFNQMVDQLHELESVTRVMSVSIETILARRASRLG